MSLGNKLCETCGRTFQRKPKSSDAEWADKSFCSLACSNDAKKDKPLHLRFWEYAGVSDGNQCWKWHGTTDDRGYGRISFRTQKIKAHRVSYELRYGPIPDGFVICHACDNPNCVNPNHLYADTQKANMQDASRKGRLNPKSLKNLRPGASGVRGAGPQAKGGVSHGG